MLSVPGIEQTVPESSRKLLVIQETKVLRDLNALELLLNKYARTLQKFLIENRNITILISDEYIKGDRNFNTLFYNVFIARLKDEPNIIINWQEITYYFGVYTAEGWKAILYRNQLEFSEIINSPEVINYTGVTKGSKSELLTRIKNNEIIIIKPPRSDNPLDIKKRQSFRR